MDLGLSLNLFQKMYIGTGHNNVPTMHSKQTACEPFSFIVREDSREDSWFWLVKDNGLIVMFFLLLDDRLLYFNSLTLTV